MRASWGSQQFLGWYADDMKDATIVIPEALGDELEAVAREQGLSAAEVIAAALRLYREVEHVRKQQDEPIALETVVEDALREYLTRRQRLGGREYRPAFRPFKITPVEEKDDLGEPDVSINHDKYIAEDIATRKLPNNQ